VQVRFDALGIRIFAKIVQEKRRRTTQFAAMCSMQCYIVDLPDGNAAGAAAKVLHEERLEIILQQQANCHSKRNNRCNKNATLCSLHRRESRNQHCRAQQNRT
jgi:hypothetical protein